MNDVGQLAAAKREGLDLPVLVFWGLALTSLILSALLAFELWIA